MEKKWLRNFFGTQKPRHVSGSPAAKRANQASKSDAETSDVPIPNPFDKPQSDFLQHAVGSAFNSFAGHLQNKFVSLEGDIKTVSKANDDLQSQVTDLRAQVAKLQEASAQKCDFPPGFPPNPSDPSPTRPPQTSNPSKVPFELRVVARIGNLGWDDDENLIVTRAKEALDQAGIKQEDYVGLCATRKKGSLAELCFSDPVLLQKAKMSFRALKHEFVSGKVVWLDVKKDREEMRPARVVHRITELIEEAESARDDRLPVEKVLNGKFVKLGPQRAGYVSKGNWVWTALAVSRYPQEFRDMATAYAEDD